jgi:hypothetical protein
MHVSVRFPLAIVLSLLLLSLLGCGEKTVVGQSSSARQQSDACMECHAATTSPVTDAVIAAEWKKSAHYIKYGAGCVDCHEPHNHPSYYCGKCHSGSQLDGAYEIQRNPDRSGKCLKCHNGMNALDASGTDFGFHGSTVNGVATDSLLYAGIAMNTERAHFNYIQSAYSTGKYPGVNDGAKTYIGEGYPASYLTSKFLYTKNASGNMKTEGQCRKCHNPHDPTTNIQYNRDYSRSAHGMTSGIPAKFYNSTRYLGFIEYDFKMAGGDLGASQAMSDVYAGKYEVCVRCHTTTGFIKYINSGYTDLKTFGTPNANDVASINDLYQAANVTTLPLPYNGKYSGKFNAYRGDISQEKSREVIACNACHDNGNESAFSWAKLRKVPQVTSYYNYGPNTTVGKSKMPGATGDKFTGFGLKFPDVGVSNSCVACHSGRTFGINLKMADARQLTYTSGGQGKFDAHYKQAAMMVFRPTYNGRDIGGAGFEFYSSGSTKLQNYENVQFGHDLIGTTTTRTVTGAHVDASNGNTRKADPRLYGPCVGCHQNVKESVKGTQSSHTFLPINRDASATYYNTTIMAGKSSEPISGVVSKACANCHHESEWDESGKDPALGDLADATEKNTTYNKLDIQRNQLVAARKAFQRLLTYATNIAATSSSNPPSPTDWYGTRSTETTGLQKWLRTEPGSGRGVPSGSHLTYYVQDGNGGNLNLFDDPILGLNKLRNATYTIGAFYNFSLLERDTGAYAHNRRYVKRLMYDSMDWLDDGRLNKSVCDPNDVYTSNNPSSGVYRKFMKLNTRGGTGILGLGAGSPFKYTNFGMTEKEFMQASYYICQSIAKTYNSDGTISSFTYDHRPAP